MIIQVGFPKHTSERWCKTIDSIHKEVFGWHMYRRLIHEHAWFVDIKRGIVRGVAGTKEYSNPFIFLGPCMVLPAYRGHGIQKNFIRVRETYGKKIGYNDAVSFVHYKNYISLNNFLVSKYKIIPPWGNECIDTGQFIYLGKKL